MSIKAVFLGVLVDIGGTMAFGFVLGAALFAGSGMTQAAIQEGVRALLLSNEMLVVIVFFGLTFTVLGGYTAARVAAKQVFSYSGG